MALPEEPRTYPFPSDVKVADFVPVKLSRTNYKVWSRMMLDLIKEYEMDDFIREPPPPERIAAHGGNGENGERGEIENPEMDYDERGEIENPEMDYGERGEIENPEMDYDERGGIENPNYKLWVKSDKLVRRWIMATITEDLIPPIIVLRTAKEMWTYLEQSQQTYFEEETVDEIDYSNNPASYVKLFQLIKASQSVQEGDNETSLRIASFQGDWETADRIISDVPDIVRAPMTESSSTSLMLAVTMSERNNQFVEKLLLKMEPIDLEMKEDSGWTALHCAVSATNLEATKMLVQKNPNLPNMANTDMIVPLHLAAGIGNREMVVYLLGVTKDDVEPNPYEGERAAKLLIYLALNGHYDIAIKVLSKYPNIRSTEEPYNLLDALARRPTAFLSGTKLNIWERLLYSCVSVPGILDDVANLQIGGVRAPRAPNNVANNQAKEVRIPVERDNVVNPQFGGTQKLWAILWKVAEKIGTQKLCAILWKVAEKIVAAPKSVRDKKKAHRQALELVKCLCNEANKQDYVRARKLFKVPLINAGEDGIHEIVEEILRSFPLALITANEKKQSIFQIAIVHRKEKVYNLLYQFSEYGNLLLSCVDTSGNNALHLAGCLTPQQQLSLRASAAGPALQMQRELQWFKEVEKFMRPHDKEHKNAEGKTPADLFTETHKDLLKEGEKWMRATSNSYTLVASLIATGVFSAGIDKILSAINNDGSVSKLTTETTFIIFVIADALALFSSISSISMFLSILTSRYAEDDFLYALPKRLLVGLFYLFLSMIFMMVAFGATFYLGLRDNKDQTIALGIALPCLPVALFAVLQFQLILLMIKSTCFPGIFGKQSKRALF